MRKLSDLEARVKLELKGVANIAKNRTNIRDTINEAYRKVCAAHPWPWLIQSRPWVQLPDTRIAVLADDNETSQVSLSGLRNLITTPALFAAEWGLTLTGEANAAEPVADLLSNLLGATVELDDPTLATSGNGNWHLAPFEVWQSQTNLYVGGGVVTAFLDPRAMIQEFTGAEGDVLFRFPRHLLPADVEQVLEVWEVETDPPRRLRPWTQDQARQVNLNDDGDPMYFWLDEPFRPKYPHRGVSATAFAAVRRDRNAGWLYGTQMDPPVQVTGEPITVATGTSGNLLAGEYTVFFTWMAAGRLGPPSDPVTLTLSGANDQIVVSNVPNQDPGSPKIPFMDGYPYALLTWVAKDDGPFYLHQEVPSDVADALEKVLPDDPLADANPEDTFTIDDHVLWSRPHSAVRWDEVNNGPIHRYLSVWPRPTTPKRMEYRALLRPRALIAPTDCPLIPAGFEDVIVWAAVAQLASVQNGDEGTRTRAEALFRERFDLLRRRYGFNDGLRIQREAAGAESHPGLAEWPFAVDWRGDS